MGFHNDINSKHLGNFVLVTIGRSNCNISITGQSYDIPNIGENECSALGGTWTGRIHRLSTRKITFDNEYYKPILLNIPSISESLDIENRKYKISSVSLSISDYMEDGERFSDHLNTLMNQEVTIWFASQSSKTLDIDECYKAGTFIVRSFSQNEDKVTLNCEDLSQDKLHKDFPLEVVPDTADILDKYKTKPKPMVFGKVDKSPCIIENNDGDQIIRVDYKPDDDFSFPFETVVIGGDDFNNSPLFIFYNEAYVNIAQQATNPASTELNNAGNNNFTPEPASGFIRLDTDIENDTQKGNLRIIATRKAKDAEQIIETHSNGTGNLHLYNEHLIIDGNNDTFGILHGGYNTMNPSDNISSYDFGQIDPRTGTGAELDNSFWHSWIRVHLENISTINASDVVVDKDGNTVDDFTYVYLKFKHEGGSDNAWSPVWGVVVGGNDHAFYNFNYQASANYPAYGGILAGSSFPQTLAYGHNTEALFDTITGNHDPISIFDWSITDTYDHLNIGYFRQSDENETSNEDLRLSVRGALYNAFVIHSAVIKGIDKYNFFISTIGRGGVDCTLDKIYNSILVDELLFDGTINFPTGIAPDKYAFSIDKKISSKKLLEEISASSGLFPYFKDGNFNVKSIDKGYEPSSLYKLIKAIDVIKYQYKRSSINKVYHKVNVKYHYDYGLKDFTKETGDITYLDLKYTEGGQVINPTSEQLIASFGADFDQELEFESKYIRDSATASNLAKYLLGLHFNQHNLISIKLPLNYLTLELGDICRLDKLIDNRKIFGEDYSFINPEADIGYVRNGQTIYKFWFVQKIKKSLDSVEVELYQLHSFRFDESQTYDPGDVVEPPVIITVPFCLDSLALNYDQEGYDDALLDPELNPINSPSICTYSAVSGCMTPGADNYNSEATEDDGSCQFSGCTDIYATNYEGSGDNWTDDGSCTYPAAIEYCDLEFNDEGYPFLEYHQDASGNDVSEGINNPAPGQTYNGNEDLCLTPTDPYPDTMGWCKLSDNSVMPGQVSQFVCEVENEGTWSTDQWVTGCTDEDALNPNEAANITDNTQCQYPIPIVSPVISSPTEDQVIDAEFTEAVEAGEGGVFVPPAYELATPETERTLINNTSTLNDSGWWASRTGDEYMTTISGDGWVGVRFWNLGDVTNHMSVHNGGLTQDKNVNNSQIGSSSTILSDAIDNGLIIPGVTELRIRAKIRWVRTDFTGNGHESYNPDRVSVRPLGVHRTTSYPFATSKPYTVNEGWQIVDLNDIHIGGGAFIVPTGGRDSIKFAVTGSTIGIGDEMHLDWISIIPYEEVAYEVEVGAQSTPYIPPTISAPSIPISFLTSTNLIHPYGLSGGVTIPNTSYKLYIKNEEDIYYEGNLGELADNTVWTNNILLDPMTLPPNIPIELAIFALDESGSDYHPDYAQTSISFVSTSVFFIWGDNNPILLEIIEDIGGILSLLVDAMQSNGVGNLTPEQLVYYDYDGDGVIDVQDFNYWIAILIDNE